MADAMHLYVRSRCADLGLQRNAKDLARVRAVMVKGEPDVSGKVRGHCHTMLTDGDMNPQREYRGALGGLAGGVFGDGRIFVSGGAEHQGPAGGGLIAAIAEVAVSAAAGRSPPAAARSGRARPAPTAPRDRAASGSRRS